MSKTGITRTELVWPGKYDEEGNLVLARRVNLPFQVIETHAAGGQPACI